MRPRERELVRIAALASKKVLESKKLLVEPKFFKLQLQTNQCRSTK